MTESMNHEPPPIPVAGSEPTLVTVAGIVTLVLAASVVAACDGGVQPGDVTAAKAIVYGHVAGPVLPPAQRLLVRAESFVGACDDAQPRMSGNSGWGVIPASGAYRLEVIAIDGVPFEGCVQVEVFADDTVGMPLTVGRAPVNFRPYPGTGPYDSAVVDLVVPADE